MTKCLTFFRETHFLLNGYELHLLHPHWLQVCPMQLKRPLEAGSAGAPQRDTTIVTSRDESVFFAGVVSSQSTA